MGKQWLELLLFAPATHLRQWDNMDVRGVWIALEALMDRIVTDLAKWAHL